MDIGGRGNIDRGVVGVTGNALSNESPDDDGVSGSDPESESLHLDDSSSSTAVSACTAGNSPHDSCTL